MWMVSSGKPLFAPPFHQVVAEHRADRAIRVDDRQFERDRLAHVHRGRGQFQQLVIECPLQSVILRDRLAAPRTPSCGFLAGTRMGVRSRPSAFQCSNGILGFQQIGAADQVIHLANSQSGHDLRGLPRPP